jgi:hypothetical protein
MRISANKEKFQ